ncbi:MAG: (deoxy)nucleoside triphosphate pyrophosphohydrolase [Thermotaleaceae bacterium]
MEPLIVTAAIIRRNGKILIAQRYPSEDHGLEWEFPGGKLEIGETPEACLKREIKEELNLDISVEDIFKVVYHTYPQKTILLLCYLCTFAEGEAKPLECNAFQWIYLEEVYDYNFAGADLPIVEKILKKGEQIFEID